MERNREVWAPCLDDMDSHYMAVAAPIYQMQYQLLAGQSYAANPSAPSNPTPPRAISPLTDAEEDEAACSTTLTGALLPAPMPTTDPLDLDDLVVIMTDYNPSLQPNQRYPWKDKSHDARFKWTEKARKLAREAEVPEDLQGLESKVSNIVLKNAIGGI